MNVTSLLILSGAGFGLLIIVALLVRRDANIRANRFLAGSLACSMCYLIGISLILAGHGEGQSFPALLASAYIIGPPLMLGYVQLLISPGYQLTPRHALHLLPWCLLAALLGSIDGGVNLQTLEQARSGWPPSRTSLIAAFLYLVSAGYMGVALRLLNIHKSSVEEHFSYHDRQSLRWLRILVGVYLGLSLAGLTIAVIRWLPGVELWPRSLYSSGMIIAIYYLIAFIGISQPARPQQAAAGAATDLGEDAPSTRGQSPSPEPRYETSALTAEAAEAIWAHLEQLMREQQPYLDSKLRIADLARMMDIPPHYLSQTINRVAGKNFFEFVNHYRVERAKALLESGNLPASSIAFEAGFNSNSAFYRQFKKDTGTTPRQFQRQLGTA
jgi:AraC-like DNA-binding protein